MTITIHGEILEDIRELTTSYLDEKGSEINNPKPVFVVGDMRKKPCLEDRIRTILQTMDAVKRAQGLDEDTLEDLDNDWDDPDPAFAQEPGTIYQDVVEENYDDETLAIIKDAEAALDDPEPEPDPPSPSSANDPPEPEPTE